MDINFGANNLTIEEAKQKQAEINSRMKFESERSFWNLHVAAQLNSGKLRQDVHNHVGKPDIYWRSKI